MTGTRKRYSAAFKARVALEAAKQTRTLAELSKAFQVHPVQISQWKKQLLDGAESLFGDGRRREHDETQPIELLPRAGHRVGGGPAADAADRPAVPANSVLRQPTNEGVSRARRGDGQS